MVQQAKYRLIRPLTAGGMSEIFLALRLMPDGKRRRVVVKRLNRSLGRDKTARRKFVKEARIAAILDHPNVVKVFDLGTHGKDCFLAMEFLEGKPLDEVSEDAAKRGEPLSLDLLSWVALGAARALDHAHSRADAKGTPLGIVHRDVNASNLLLTYDGQVKLLDFGLATVGGQDAQNNGELEGTFGYMAPEQCKGEPVDSRSDLFLFGILLYELIAGVPLFRRESQFAMIQAILNDPIPPLAERRDDVPEDLEALTMRALQRDLDKRFSSAGALVGALEAMRRQQGWEAGDEELRAAMDTLYPEFDRLADGVGPEVETPPRAGRVSGAYDAVEVETDGGERADKELSPDDGDGSPDNGDTFFVSSALNAPVPAPEVDDTHDEDDEDDEDDGGEAGELGPMLVFEPIDPAAEDVSSPAAGPGKRLPRQTAKVDPVDAEEDGLNFTNDSDALVFETLPQGEDDEPEKPHGPLVSTAVSGSARKAQSGAGRSPLGLVLVVLLLLAAGGAVYVLAGGLGRGATGTLSVTSEPEGAQVMLGDQLQPGKTPVVLSGVPLDKKVPVVLLLGGHEPHATTVRLEADQPPPTVHVRLKALAGAGVAKQPTVTAKKPAETATLEVWTEVEGAQVLLNGEAQGEAPLALDGIRCGQTHTLVVRAPGHSEFSLQLADLKPGENRVVEPTLDKEDK